MSSFTTRRNEGVFAASDDAALARLTRPDAEPSLRAMSLDPSSPAPEPLPPTPAPASATPPPLPPARFRLSAAAWIAWSIYAAVVIGFAVHRGLPDDAYQQGRAVGRVVGALLVALVVPSLLALLAWRLCRRSHFAGMLTFFVALGLLAGSQVLQRLRAPSPDAIRRMANEGGDALSQATRDGLSRYNAAAAALEMATFFTLATHDSPEKIAVKRQALANYAAANAELQHLHVNGAEILRENLKKRGLPPNIVDAAVAGHVAGGRKNFSLLLKIHEADARLATAMGDFLDVAEGRHGKWTATTEGGRPKLVFADAAGTARYKEIAQRSTAIIEELTAYRKQLLTTTPAPAK